MKKRVVFIGNRCAALQELCKRTDSFHLQSLFLLSESFLHKEVNLFAKYFEEVLIFDETEKQRVFELLLKTEFDVLFSNGNPFVLPISALQPEKRLFINVHPTYLPYLKGKTPLNGIFYLGYDFLGATVHFMDNGIDTGNIIVQKKIPLTEDLDQGLVYYSSFSLEADVFQVALDILIRHNFNFKGTPQSEGGSVFNRKKFMMRLDFRKQVANEIIRSVKSFSNMGCETEIDGRRYVIVEAIPIHNSYLLDKFSDCFPGSIAHQYEDKLLIQAVDGLIKCRIKMY